MFELNGKYTTAKIYADSLDSGAIGRLQTILNQPCMEGNRVRVMADAHDSAGCVVGTTFNLSTDRVIPSVVGSDIACGVLVVELKEKRIDLPKLDSFISKEVPSGASVRKKYHKYTNKVNLGSLKCIKAINLDKAYASLGSLGGGNHFISIEKSENGTLYLLMHSGSRHLGRQVCEYYQKMAYEYHNKSLSYYLSYLEGDLFKDYLHDMEVVSEFAYYSRLAIAETILSGLKLHEVNSFTTVHNYIDTQNRIVRKGAVSAQLDEQLIIPINMKDGSLICKGKGNDDYNCSAPHGAGRLLSRSESKQILTVSEYKKIMKESGIYTTSANASTLDESPMAYKPIEVILSNISDTVDILEHIKPIYNFKASGEDD